MGVNDEINSLTASDYDYTYDKYSNPHNRYYDSMEMYRLREAAKQPYPSEKLRRELIEWEQKEKSRKEYERTHPKKKDTPDAYHIEKKRVRLSKGVKVYSRALEMEGYIITPLRIEGTKENLIAVRYIDKRVFIHSLEKDVENTIYPVEMYNALVEKNALPKEICPAIDRYDANVVYKRYRDFYHAYSIEVPNRLLKGYSQRTKQTASQDILDIFKEADLLREHLIDDAIIRDYDNLSYSEWDPDE